jgi:hypothetical protein
MKRTIGIIIIFVTFVAGAMLLTGCGNKKTAEQTQPVENIAATTTPAEEQPQISKPWIQVVKAGVFMIADSASSVVLNSGDELNEGVLVETDTTGLANIVFPDGSVARLDSNTSVIISVGSYNEDTKTLSVRLKLAAGNLWSKIMTLATPESFWEVQTSNAVAAVRGTAFGVSFAKDTTTIIGSEHQVTVRAINPETRAVIAEQDAIVDEGKYVVITAANIESLVKKTARLADWIKVTPKIILDQAWIKSALSADARINTQLKSAESMGLTEVQSQELYVDTIIEEKAASQNNAATTTDDGTTATTTIDSGAAIDVATTTDDGVATTTMTIKPLSTTKMLTTLPSATSSDTGTLTAR